MPVVLVSGYSQPNVLPSVHTLLTLPSSGNPPMVKISQMEMIMKPIKNSCISLLTFGQRCVLVDVVGMRCNEPSTDSGSCSI